jgi:hypothetical protein
MHQEESNYNQILDIDTNNNNIVNRKILNQYKDDNLKYQISNATKNGLIGGNKDSNMIDEFVS